MSLGIWLMLAILRVQLGRTNEIKNTQTLPMSYICDDKEIKELADDLKFVRLMNQNMHLSNNQQFEDLKKAVSAIDAQKSSSAVATAANASGLSNAQPGYDIAHILKFIELMNENIQHKLDSLYVIANELKLVKLTNENIQHKLDSFNNITNQLEELKKAIAAIDVHNTSYSASNTFDISYTPRKYCEIGRSGIQLIHIPNTKLTPSLVNCIQDPEQGDPWILIQRRSDGSIDFNRDWSDYKQGFGNLEGEFFIGLDNLHALTQSAWYELWIQMEDYSNEKRWAKYSRFAVGDESQAYALNTLGSFTGNAGDSMTYHALSKFTTKDKDNDEESSQNCAVVYSGAWWHKSCHLSNLNGLYLRGEYSKENFAKGIVWKTWRGYLYSLKYVHMAIRPVKLS